MICRRKKSSRENFKGGGDKDEIQKKEWRQVSCYLMVGAVFCVLASVWGFIFYDLILASTQWLLIAAVLSVFGLYARIES